MKNLKKNSTLFLLGIILLIGAFLRLQGAFTGSFAFTYDVGRDMLAVSQILSTHKLPLIGPTTGLHGLFYGPWWYYILIVPFIPSGGNPAGIVVFIAITGILTSFIAYILGKKISGNFLGLSFAGLVAVSPVMIGITSQIWNPNLAPFFIVFLFLLFHHMFVFLEKKKVIPFYYFLLFGVLLGLIFDTEIVFGLLLDSAMVLSLIIIIWKKIRVSYVLSTVLGFLIILAPRMLFELRHQFLMSKNLVATFTHPAGNSVSSFSPQILNRLISLKNLWDETLAVKNSLLGTLLLIFAFASVIYFYKKTITQTKSFIKIIIITLVVFFVGLNFLSGDVWSHYVVGIPLFYIFILAIAFDICRKQKKFAFVILAAVVILLILNLKPLELYKNVTGPRWEGDASVYRNQVAVIDYIYLQAKGKPFKYVTYTPPIYDYTYQYLFAWYGKNTYHYIPVSKSDLAFFILEPDTQYPFRLTDWLKSREKDGKVIRDKVVKGGIRVQTRVP